MEKNARKDQEKKKKEEELKRLKNLKKMEIVEKLQEINKITAPGKYKIYIEIHIIYYIGYHEIFYIVKYRNNMNWYILEYLSIHSDITTNRMLLQYILDDKHKHDWPNIFLSIFYISIIFYIHIVFSEADLEDDFKPDEWDKKMSSMFNDDYYNQPDDNIKEVEELAKPVFEVQ